MKSIALSLIVSTIIVGLSGCGGGAELSPQQMQKVKSFDVSKINTFGDTLHKAMNEDELLFYAPININKAKEDYESALSAETKDEKMALYLRAKKELANAYETKKLVQKYLSDVAEIDAKMQKLSTQSIFPSRYADFRDDYADLIEEFDEGKVSDAIEDKKDVMVNAINLYGDAVVYRNINKAKMIMQKMASDDLDEMVPLHYEKLQKLYEVTRLNVKREPDNRSEVKKLAKELNEFAIYTYTLSKEVKHLRDVGEDGYESYLDRVHHEIASLNKDENEHSILPLSIENKVIYLKQHSYTKIVKVQPKEIQKEEKAHVEAMVPIIVNTPDITSSVDMSMDTANKNTNVENENVNDTTDTTTPVQTQHTTEAAVVTAVSQETTTPLAAQPASEKVSEQEAVTSEPTPKEQSATEGKVTPSEVIVPAANEPVAKEEKASQEVQISTQKESPAVEETTPQEAVSVKEAPAAEPANTVVESEVNAATTE
jgi:hypothetical protein